MLRFVQVDELTEFQRKVVRLEIPLLSVAYLYFVFSDQLPIAIFLLLASVWLSRAWLGQKLVVRTPLDYPILLLLLLLPVNLWVTSNLAVTLPKVYGLVLGIAFFYALVRYVATTRGREGGQLGLVLFCFTIAVAGLVGTDWAQERIASAPYVYENLPRLIQGIPRSIAGGFARNGIAGTLTFTIPLLTALLLVRRRIEPQSQKLGASASWHSRWTEIDWEIWLQYLIVVSLTLSGVVLALTQSRGGIVGTAVGLAALLVWQRPRVGLGVSIGALLIVLATVIFGRASALASMISGDTVASRLEVWQRGWMMVQDFPFTGIGLGMYNQVAHLLYPFFIAASDEIVAHSHNQILQVAVDLGIPGLVAYLGLLGAFAFCALAGYRGTDDAKGHALIVGISAGMVAHHVFGLTDAFVLGTKPGLVMWLYFAFAGGLYARHEEMRNGERRHA